MAGPSPRSIYDVEQIARLPRHLKQYIVDQTYERYTPVDHAVWRHVMRHAVAFHRRHAHEAYIEGLRKTGIGLERIPKIDEMNTILGRIGWGAAPVDGFIPPAAFMEFQAHRVLVIAADMRQADHIEYTPAPDIVHEAAGHAPIIADEEYAEYLRLFGEYGTKALSSQSDGDLYEAVRHLSIIKEAPGTRPDELRAAEERVAGAQASLGEPSEMALLTRLHWWTVEYGLIGELDSPKIYGAGLLSSIGEAARCLTPATAKIRYSIDAARVPFDITSYQPQLFVAESFAHLRAVLEEFVAGLSFRRGGAAGLKHGLGSGQVVTATYSSGLQVSGRLCENLLDADGEPAYLRTEGPTALATAGRQLAGHGTGTHAAGFGSPVGWVRGSVRPLEQLDDAALRSIGLLPGRDVRLEFTSGVVVAGKLERILREESRIVLLCFSTCRVTLADRLLFDPAWGAYDMAVGERIVSVSQGAADKDAYEEIGFAPRERTIRTTMDAEGRNLAGLYASVREIREADRGHDTLSAIFREVRERHPSDWLLALEILEILTAKGGDPGLEREVRLFLDRGKEDASRAQMISAGLALLATT